MKQEDSDKKAEFLMVGKPGTAGHGGFLPASKGFRRRFADNCLPELLFLQWRSACTLQFQYLGQDRSTVAQRAETTMDERSLASCLRARFPDRFPHYTWTAESAHSDFVRSRVYACLEITWYLHFWQNDRGLLSL